MSKQISLSHTMAVEVGSHRAEEVRAAVDLLLSRGAPRNSELKLSTSEAATGHRPLFFVEFLWTEWMDATSGEVVSATVPITQPRTG